MRTISTYRKKWAPFYIACNDDNEMVRRLVRQPELMIEVGKSQTEDIVMQIKSIGIDLGKTTFHLVTGHAFPGRSAQEVFSATTVVVHGQSALVVDWDGGLCGGALSGPGPCVSKGTRCG